MPSCSVKLECHVNQSAIKAYQCDFTNNLKGHHVKAYVVFKVRHSLRASVNNISENFSRNSSLNSIRHGQLSELNKKQIDQGIAYQRLVLT